VLHNYPPTRIISCGGGFCEVHEIGIFYKILLFFRGVICLPQKRGVYEALIQQKRPHEPTINFLGRRDIFPLILQN
jgi:hypothetical protein